LLNYVNYIFVTKLNAYNLYIYESAFLIGEEMNHCIIYWSRYGNGKKVVEYIENKLKDKKQEVQVFKTDEADPTSMPDADIFFFSAPTEAFRIKKNMRIFMKKLKGMDGKKYGIINTHAMKNKNCLGNMEKILSNKKMMKIAEVDFQIGEGQNKGEGLMTGWDEKLEEFIEKFY